MSRSRLDRRLAFVAATVSLLVTGFGVWLTAANASVGSTVNTFGSSLKVRSTPHVSGTAVGLVADGASITIDCQTYGDTVSGTYGTTNICRPCPSGGQLRQRHLQLHRLGHLVAPLCGGTHPELLHQRPLARAGDPVVVQACNRARWRPRLQISH